MKVENKTKSRCATLCFFIKKHRGIILTVLVSGLAFIGVIKMISPMNVNNMGGAHSWLSGSTIKFVNNWLDEGAMNLNFTNYEDPASVEFNTLRDREPYLSYPSGETLFVYLVARITGKSQITISFLHKFQIILFGVEAILFASFVYYFLTRTIKIKSEWGRIILSVLTAILWTALPVCSYYLSNIYYADQCVILWVMAVILVEYLIRTNEDKKHLWLKIIRSVIIYSGILIDYYFWFLAFLLFLAELVEVLLKNKKGQRKKKALSMLCWFGIPAFLGVLTFFIQLNMTDGWLEIMKDRFGERVMGGEKTTEWIFSSIASNFAQAFSFGNEIINYLLILMAIIIAGGFFVVVKRGKIASVIRNPGISIVLCSVFAIVLQIFFFKQHSAVHEFSMIKVGWIVAMVPLLLSLVCYELFEDRRKEIAGVNSGRYYVLFSMSYLLVLISVGIPISTKSYNEQRLEVVDYSFEQMVSRELRYDDVAFSYTEEIPINPPQSLAMSKKRIYKIENVGDIQKKLEGVQGEAKVVLIINKGIEHKKDIQQQVDCLKSGGLLRLENELYAIFDLGNYLLCK